MPLTRHVSLASQAGVAASSTFNIAFPVGNVSYDKFKAVMSGGAFVKTDVTNLEVLANGKPIQRYKTIAHMEKIRGYYGQNVVASELGLEFVRSHLNNPRDAESFSLGASDLKTLTITGEIGAGAVTPALDPYCEQVQYNYPKEGSVQQQNVLGVFSKIRHFTKTVVGAGVTEFDDLPKENWLMALHAVTVSDKITSVAVEADGVRIWDDLTLAQMESIVEDSGRTKQALCYHMDWQLKNKIGDEPFLPGVKDFRIIVSHSANDTIVFYPEYRSSFGGI